MVVAQGKYLYAGFGAAQQLYGYTISAAGALTPINNFPYSAAYLNDYVNGVGQDNIITNPAGTLLFIPDAVKAQIHVLSIGTGGALTEVTNSPFNCPAGFSTPMNMATDGLGKYLYVIDGNDLNHQGSQIAAFAIGTGTSLGKLTPVTGSPFVGAPFNMWQLQGEPTGNFLIGTSGSTAFYTGVLDDNNLYVFSIVQSGSNAGAISLTTKQATTYSPFSIAVQSNIGGNLVYSFSFNDTGTAINGIEGYSISSTGTLTKDTGSPFSGVGNGTWGQFDQSGAYLFAYSSYINGSGTTTTVMVPLSVGAGGALTQPVSLIDLATPGFWVVTDPN
jgi:hypothetical protein